MSTQSTYGEKAKKYQTDGLADIVQFKDKPLKVDGSKKIKSIDTIYKILFKLQMMTQKIIIKNQGDSGKAIKCPMVNIDI